MRGRDALVDWWRRHPVALAVLLGLALRVVAALSGYGWFAADDYFYVIEPAWRWLGDPSLPYPSPFRSPLFPRVFSLFLAAGDLLADDPRWVLRIAYLGLGLVSLAVIPGVYALARRRAGLEAAAIAALLVAAHALMPRLATRALVEVAAMLPLVWGLVFVERSVRGSPARRFGLSLAGGSLFAVAAMVRFQVGVISLAIVAWLVWRAARDRDDPALARWAPVAGLLLAGLAGVVAQSAVDVAVGRAPFATPLAYVSKNIEVSSHFGVSAWYTYLLHLLLITVPPATVALARPLWRACRALPLVSISVAVFVVAHTLVPHKEDRFMFPILPLVLVLLAAALAELHRGGRWQRRAAIFFWVLNGLALPVACLSDVQRNWTDPLLEIASAGPDHDVVVVGALRVPVYYAGGQRVRAFASDDEFFSALETGGLEPDFVLVRPAPSAQMLARIEAAGLDCRDPRVFAGSLVDRALLSVNPRRNKRKRPTGLLDCRGSTDDQLQ